MRVFTVVCFALVTVFAAHSGFAQIREEGAFASDPNPFKTVSLYPNPSSDYLNVKFELPCAKRVKHALQNVIGNPIEVETEIIDDHEIQLKVRDLPTGYYLLTIKDPDTGIKATHKFLKR